MNQQNLKIAVYAGTFDPVTSGHVDIITRAAALYDKLIVAVSGHGRKKQTLFSLEQRIAFMQEAVEHLGNVEVLGFTNLLTQFCADNKAQVVVRGLRMTADFEYEFQMAAINRKMQPSVETLFLMARSEFTFVSSTNIKEIASLKGNFEQFVPEHVVTPLKNKFNH